MTLPAESHAAAALEPDDKEREYPEPDMFDKRLANADKETF
ncbi:MAG TPA: hypothetical protein VGY48_27590 [Vicinamibacterales bacterium]|nr:hypothetical protein [Vicinamibacterales bacterium]